MGKCKLICMAFDGEYQTERPVFDSIEDAWEYSNDLGSKWFFYPFHFVVTESGKTIVDAPEEIEQFNGMRVKTIAKQFKVLGQNPIMVNAGVDEYLSWFWEPPHRKSKVNK